MYEFILPCSFDSNGPNPMGLFVQFECKKNNYQIFFKSKVKILGMVFLSFLSKYSFTCKMVKPYYVASWVKSER